VTLIYVRVRGAPKLRRKNIRLAEKYYKFGFDSAIRKKKSAAERRRLTKFGAAALGAAAQGSTPKQWLFCVSK